MGILGHNVTTVQQASSHVLPVARVALDHLVVGLKARHGHLLDGVGLVSSLSSRDDRRISDQREVDTGIRDQVGLELVQVDVQRTIETKGSSNGRHNCAQVSHQTANTHWNNYRTLSNQAIKVDVVRALETEVSAANVVDGLVVDHEGAVGVLECGVGGKDGVVRLNHGGGSLGSRVNTELQLALLAVVDREALHQQSTETGSGTTTKGVEDQEALETSTAVGNTANLVEDLVDELLANGVVATGVVVRRILLAGDHVLGVEQAAVGAGADLVDDVRLEIAVNGSGNELALACIVANMSEKDAMEGGSVQAVPTSLGEEGAEAMVGISGFALLSEVTIGLQGAGASVRIMLDEGSCEDIPECRARGSRAKSEFDVSMSSSIIKLANAGGAAGLLC